MNVVATIFFILVICGLSFLIVWNTFKLVKTILGRRKGKDLDKDNDKVERKDK